MKPSEKVPVSIDRKFFNTLVSREFKALEIILADDFTVIDLSGAVITKAAFLASLRSGDLTFEAIQPEEVSVRVYDSTALVTGRTVMRGRYKGGPFSFSSRYTHTYVNNSGHWYLVAAQGTPIAT
jgi:ketosteroid isomerase-like protein